jgi:hypothetical protein
VSHNQAELKNGKRPWHPFGLPGLLLLTLGIALAVPIALVEPRCVMWGVPFFACSVAGALYGQGPCRTMLLYGGIGGTVGFWIGVPLIALHNVHYSLSRLAELTSRGIDSLAVAVAVANSIGNFVMGATVAAAVWGVQRTRAQVKAKGIRKTVREEGTLLKSLLTAANADRLFRILGWIFVASAFFSHCSYCEWRKVRSSDDIVPFIIPGFYSHFWGLGGTQYSREVAITHGFLVPAGLILFGVIAICLVSFVRCVRYDGRWDLFWTRTRGHWIALLAVTGIVLAMYALNALFGSQAGTA